jgi:hypothetical protein
MESSWKNKRFDRRKSIDFDEYAPTVKKGVCEYCTEKSINVCERCSAEICKEHTKELKTRYPPWYKNYCPDCKKRHYLIRGISIGVTIAVFVGFAIYQFSNPPAA